MRKICTIIILFSCIFSLVPKNSGASHLVGAEITWKYLGNDTFLTSVIIERDCNGVPMPDQPFTVVPCGSYGNGVYVNTIKTGGLDITPVCKNYCTRCSESSCDFPNGFENYIFSAKVNLKAIDSNCCAFKIVWQACCRNGAITTGAAAENYYLEATMNPCIKPGDNAPVFVNAPLMLAEEGQCLSYTFAASDSDVDAYGFQDSLVYFLDTPFQALNTPVSFVAPYAFNAPILYYGTSPNDPWVPDCKGFHLDMHTGDLMFKAVKQDITQVVVRVEEWGRDAKRKPYKKGETRRDVTFFTMPSTGDQVPSLSGFNGSTSYSENFCVGQKKCLTIYSADADTNNIVKVSGTGLPSGLSNATFAMDTSTKTPKTVFCWQPDSTQIGKSYQFVLNAVDNNCPMVGKTARTYTVNVFATPKAAASATNLGCGNIHFNIMPQSKIPVLNYTWLGSDGLSDTLNAFNHHYHNAGIYRWTVLYTGNGGCADTEGGNVIISKYVTATASPKDTLVCLSKHPVVNLNLSAANGSGSYSYFWTSGAVNLNDSSTLLKVPVTKDSIIIANVLDNGSKCLNWDTVIIKASGGITNVKLIPPKDTLVCFGQKISLVAEASGGDPHHYAFVWDPAGLKQNTYTFIASLPQNQLVKVSDGCSSDSSTVHITVRSPLQIRIPKDTSTCSGASVLISATGSGGIPARYIYTWEGSIGEGPTKALAPAFSQNYRLILTDGCSNPDTGYTYITVHPIPVSAFKAINTNTIQNQYLQFENNSSGAVQYLWKFGDGTNSDIINPSHQYLDTGFFNINLTAISAFGCIDSTTMKKYIHVLPAYYCYIPSAFTPNNDSLNESFGPKGQAIKDFTIEIFSRFGNTIYKGNKNWDGTYKGQILSDGMFYYYLIVDDMYGETHTYFNHFYLLN